MNITRIPRKFPGLKKVLARQQTSQVAALDQDEYTETPEYPPILDLSIQARNRRKREELYAKIQRINTVEEKQIALNMPRYYGWRSVMLRDDKVPYNALPLVKGFTKTHFVPIEKLPDRYAEYNQAADEIAKEIKPLIEDAISCELEAIQYYNHTPSVEKPIPEQQENEIAKHVARQVNRVICNTLADKASHILSAQVDYEPRHEAFWFVGGVDVPQSVIKWRKSKCWMKEPDRLYENVDRPVQYVGTPLLAIRSHHPLKPLIPYSDAENPDFKVEKFTYDPSNVGYTVAFRHGTNISGFWPGDYDEFGLLSIHGRGHILSRRDSFGPEDNLEALHCQAIKASFGWLCAQANYQGFTTYNDLTYPLVSQTILTNGQLWSMYAYQLNTITMHNEQIDENKKHNICFGSKPLQLYESIENGKIKGLNEDVLKMVVQLYLNTPEKRDHEMKPYLGKEEQVVADIEDDKKRCWLEDRYKQLVSNRPRHLLPYEVYMWEKIYKIDYNTRFFERRVRPFELDINPYRRRLDEHTPPYIPKALRPYPRHKKKFESTYYPDV